MPRRRCTFGDVGATMTDKVETTDGERPDPQVMAQVTKLRARVHETFGKVGVPFPLATKSR